MKPTQDVLDSIPTFVLEGEFFHYSPACTKTIGPKGGVKERYEVWRKNGRLQFPNHSWQLPIKHGLYSYHYIDLSNVHLFHREEDCPCYKKNHGKRCQNKQGEWSGSPAPDDPDHFWVCDVCGASIPAKS